MPALSPLPSSCLPPALPCLHPPERAPASLTRVCGDVRAVQQRGLAPAASPQGSIVAGTLTAQKTGALPHLHVAGTKQCPVPPSREKETLAQGQQGLEEQRCSSFSRLTGLQALKDRSLISYLSV